MVMLLFVLFFFFFKQKTAYEIGWCDWSSDVCSSDLCRRAPGRSRRAGDAAALDDAPAGPTAECCRILAGARRQAEGGAQLHGDDLRRARRARRGRSARARQADRPGPGRDDVSATRIEIRRQVAIAGRVTVAPSGDAASGALVAITSAPAAFEERLGWRAALHGGSLEGVAERPDQVRAAPDGYFHFLDLLPGTYGLTA